MLASLACLVALSQGTAPKAEVSFLSEVKTVRPGVPFAIALQIEMPPEWHTYYLNPGDAGQATEIHWKLPPGFTTTPIQWPVPKRVDFQGIASYVYEDKVSLLTTVTVPKTWQTGKPIHLSAHVTWLLCSTGCVPQSADLTLDLPTAQLISFNAPATEAFQKARAALPMVVSSVHPTAKVAGKNVVLKFNGITSADGAQFIPADVDSFGANEAKSAVAGGMLQMTLPLTPYAKKPPVRVKGILVTPQRAYSIDAPVS